MDEVAQAFERARKSGKQGLIITGPIGSGKTSVVLALSAALRTQGVLVDGVASPRIVENGQTVGYRVRDVRTGQEHPLCSRHPPGLRFRRFYFSPAGLAAANAILARAAAQAEVIVVDEVGPLELSGQGFAPGLARCLTARAFLVLTVRPHLVPEFLARFAQDFAVFSLEVQK